MKNVVRILTLTAALAISAIPPATSETYGTCRYTCCSTTSPLQCQSATPYMSQSACCSGDLYCPPGTTLRLVTFNGRRCA